MLTVFEKDAYVVTGLLDGPIPNIIDVGPVQCHVVSITFDPSLEGVPNTPQGLGSACLQFTSETSRDSLFSISGVDTVLILVDAGVTWDPATERPPDAAIIIVDFDLVTTDIGLSCVPA